jgi:hypothetical protein
VTANYRAPRTAFKPGRSGNPGGRPKALADVIELARTHTPIAIKRLASIVRDDEAPPAAQVAASMALLDRAWGKPVQPVDADVNLRASYVIRAPSAIESAEQWLRLYAPGGMVEPIMDTGDNGST